MVCRQMEICQSHSKPFLKDGGRGRDNPDLKGGGGGGERAL